MMSQHRYGRIVNVSTDMATHESGLAAGGYPAYRVSKAALNAMTRVMAADLRGTNVLVNAMSPGWVRTDMGGAGAPRTGEQGADTTVWLATLPIGVPPVDIFAIVNRSRRSLYGCGRMPVQLRRAIRGVHFVG